MAVADDNKRISVKFTKEDYDKIKALADKDNRSVSNYISVVLKNHINGK